MSNATFDWNLGFASGFSGEYHPKITYVLTCVNSNGDKTEFTYDFFDDFCDFHEDGVNIIRAKQINALVESVMDAIEYSFDRDAIRETLNNEDDECISDKVRAFLEMKFYEEKVEDYI